MVQRAGRIDRIGSDFPVLWVYNMFPEEGLDRLLGLVESLSRKINDIDRTGFLDASILGEIVHPQNFNTLRRIMGEDGKVVEEQEQFAELASNEFLLQQLRALLQTGAKTMLEELPDGIHSGLPRQGERGIFFYFTVSGAEGQGRRHFWRYYDLRTGKILDNRFLITNLIACSPDTPRVIGDANVFEIQEKIVDDILHSVHEQEAVEAAPKIVDPIQQAVMTVLRGYLSSPMIKRQDVKDAMQRLSQPMTHTSVKSLRKTYEEFQTRKEIQVLLKEIQELQGQSSAPDMTAEGGRVLLKREDLHLICFDFVWS
jgi:hypothetical protein